MTTDFPEKLKSKRGQMDEPSSNRSLDRQCRCGEKLWYLGVKYHNVTFATMLRTDDDGEPIYGDRTAPAPYAYWMCINGHQETDGY